MTYGWTFCWQSWQWYFLFCVIASRLNFDVISVVLPHQNLQLISKTCLKTLNIESCLKFYIHLTCYLELFHTVRAKAGSVFMTKTDWTTDWNGVNWNLHTPTTTSEQVILCFKIKKKVIFQQCTFMHQFILNCKLGYFFKI